MSNYAQHRGGDREHHAAMVQEGTRGATPCQRSGAAAARVQEGKEELFHIQGQEGRPRPR